MNLQRDSHSDFLTAADVPSSLTVLPNMPHGFLAVGTEHLFPQVRAQLQVSIWLADLLCFVCVRAGCGWQLSGGLAPALAAGGVSESMYMSIDDWSATESLASQHPSCRAPPGAGSALP